MLYDHNIVPLNWSKVVESPKNGGNMGFFFPSNLYKARFHVVQSPSDVVVKEHSPAQKRNFKDSHSLFEFLGNQEKKANIWHMETCINSFFSVHFTHIAYICSQASLSTIPPSFSPNWAPHLCLSSLLSTSWLCTLIQPLSQWLKNKRIKPLLF